MISADASPAFITGAITGLLCLLNPVSILVCLLWTGVLLTSDGVGKKVVVPALAVFVATAILVSSPWNLRNYRVFHQWVFVRDNLGYELYQSNNDLASSAEVRNLSNRSAVRTQLNFNPVEAESVRGMGEVKYYNRRTELAVNWIRQHPGKFAELTAHRVFEFWFPATLNVDPSAYSIWLVTLLSVPGLVLMVRRRYSAAWFTLLVFAAYPLVYYLVQSSHRFRVPVFWLTLLAAGYWLNSLAAPVLGFVRARGEGSRDLLQQV